MDLFEFINKYKYENELIADMAWEIQYRWRGYIDKQEDEEEQYEELKEDIEEVERQFSSIGY